MSEPFESAALVELLGAISDRRIRRKVRKLLQFGEEAVRSLGELDSALSIGENEQEQLQIVADAVLSHVRRLLEFLGIVAASVQIREDAVPHAIGFEFSAGDSLESDNRIPIVTPNRRKPFGIDPGKTDEDKWREVAGEMDTLQFGLASEIKEFDQRFAQALAQDRKDQAVRDLNDATNALMDGVFVVLTTVYECFLGYAEPDRMIPGHRDTLGKALAVRRALAELRREVQELNRTIQERDSSPLIGETSYRLMVESLAAFIESDVFKYVRSDERKEFENFRDLLSAGSAARNRQECEGLDKYLDSLAFVSQRGVLIKHDNDLRAKIATELERALAYAELLPDVVCEAIHQCFIKADRLFGLFDDLDDLVYQWFSLSDEQRADPDQAVAMGHRLMDLLKPETLRPPPADGDFL